MNDKCASQGRGFFWDAMAKALRVKNSSGQGLVTILKELIKAQLTVLRDSEIVSAMGAACFGKEILEKNLRVSSTGKFLTKVKDRVT